MTNGPGEAVRIVAHCPRDPASLLDAVLARAHDLAVKGWVRAGEPEHLRAPGDARPAALHVHAEGDADGVTALVAFVRDAVGGPIDVEPVAVEGHEQFAVRGVIAGAFVVQEHQATAHHFDLRLQVGGVMRSWAVPKGPSLDPAVKRFAVAVGDHAIEHNDFEGREPAGVRGAIVWDRGGYEQGGRVAWPQALERGHAVFVLHGFKLRGGFALQRTGAERSGKPAQWLLIKRRDAEARPGSDIVSERPESILTGRTLQELLDN